MVNSLEKIFRDTRRFYETDDELKKAIEFTRTHQRLYFSGDEIECGERKSFDTKIIVSKKRSFDAARSYRGEKIGVLNFANSFTPGGGVLYGARAQEESLCRISTLYAALTANEMMMDFYSRHIADENPLGTDDVIFSPRVVVFRSDDSEMRLLDKSEWFEADVLTCAAPDLGEFRISDERLFSLHERRWRQILSVARANGCTVLILGAFGCGAFHNNPEVVANAARASLADFRGDFKAIEFAVACKSDWTNYDVFSRILGNGI